MTFQLLLEAQSPRFNVPTQPSTAGDYARFVASSSESSADSSPNDGGIVAALEILANPERQHHEKAYLKSPLIHLGVAVPEVRRICRSWARQQELDHDALMEQVENWWANPIYEVRLCAVELLSYRADLLGPTDLGTLRDMIAGTFTWALVDPLAIYVTSSILNTMTEEQIDSALDQWAVDRSFWVRRASLLSQLQGLRLTSGDPTRFFRYADQMLSESEFFIQKAIGWVLRDMSKKRPDLVFDWLLPRAPSCSSVTIREATKYLSGTQRQTIATLRG